MALAMHPEPEHTRQERFSALSQMLKERFDRGILAELQPLPQWVVWRAELEDKKPKKVPYNPNHNLVRASVKTPNSRGTLEQALKALESGKYSGLGFMITPHWCSVTLITASTGQQAQSLIRRRKQLLSK